MRPGSLVLGGLILAASLALLLHTMLDPDGWSQRQRILNDLEQLRAENTRLEARVDHLRAEIEALRKRPEVQERVVRDELGFVEPGDVVVNVGENE